MTVVATIEARMGSSRLPGKVLLEAAGKPYLQHMIERVSRARWIDRLVVATTTAEKDLPIVQLCERLSVPAFRGSEDDVMARVVDAGRAHGADVSVLLTGDCPLHDPHVIDQHICAFLAARPHVDLVCNVEVRSYPHGLDVIVCGTETLARSLALADRPSYHEHTGWLLRRRPDRFRRQDLIAPPGISDPAFRITLDTPADHERIRAIFEALHPVNPAFTTSDILALARARGWVDA